MTREKLMHSSIPMDTRKDVVQNGVNNHPSFVQDYLSNHVVGREILLLLKRKGKGTILMQCTNS
ncbi:hypothetical protein H5410_011234 [Solanum commersonii]|uniref:Uncharacterized protein n=1 Tax=Solanum commersonii TaxID=4109 RepID=A0A9J6AMY7_SOLCO|nr:hypothetical protein H5410_011234 [Solanum commersonii]